MKPPYNGMIPPAMVRRLADLWPDGRHVITEYGERTSDETVWAAARAGGFTIVSKDSDFADATNYPGPPPHVVRLRVGNSISVALEAYIRAHAEEIEDFAASNERFREI